MIFKDTVELTNEHLNSGSVFDGQEIRKIVFKQMMDRIHQEIDKHNFQTNPKKWSCDYHFVEYSRDYIKDRAFNTPNISDIERNYLLDLLGRSERNGTTKFELTAKFEN